MLELSDFKSINPYYNMPVPVKMSFSTQLLILHSDSPCYNAIDKSGTSPNGTSSSFVISFFFQ